MSRFSFKGAFYRPISHESRPQSPITHPKFLCPSMNCEGFSVIDNPSSSSLISILNIHCGPTAILFCVSEIIINAIKGVSWRAFSHITKKILIIVPFRAYRYPPINIDMFVGRDRRGITSPSHAQPRLPGKSSGLPMGSHPIPAFRRSKASTTFCVPRLKMICENIFGVSTYTLTQHPFALRILKGCKVAKSFSLFYHGDILTRDSYNCQPMEV